MSGDELTGLYMDTKEGYTARLFDCRNGSRLHQCTVLSFSTSLHSICFMRKANVED